MSTSVSYLRKRLADIGRYDLLDAADRGDVSHYAAAEEAGLVRRREVTGNGSPNAAKRRAWALARITRQAPPLALKPETAKFSQETPRNGRSASIDLAAAIAEWEEAQKPAPQRSPKRSGDCRPFDREYEPAAAAITPGVSVVMTPFPAHPALPCTRCHRPEAGAALREILDAYVAMRRGEPPQTGNVLPGACCQRLLLRRPDIRAMIA